MQEYVEKIPGCANVDEKYAREVRQRDSRRKKRPWWIIDNERLSTSQSVTSSPRKAEVQIRKTRLLLIGALWGKGDQSKTGQEED